MAVWHRADKHSTAALQVQECVQQQQLSEAEHGGSVVLSELNAKMSTLTLIRQHVLSATRGLSINTTQKVGVSTHPLGRQRLLWGVNASFWVSTPPVGVYTSLRAFTHPLGVYSFFGCLLLLWGFIPPLGGSVLLWGYLLLVWGISLFFEGRKGSDHEHFEDTVENWSRSFCVTWSLMISGENRNNPVWELNCSEWENLHEDTCYPVFSSLADAMLSLSLWLLSQLGGRKDSTDTTTPCLQARSYILLPLKRSILLFLSSPCSQAAVIFVCGASSPCFLIPDTVTGRLITAELQTLTRKRIDAAVTNIERGHITKFSTALFCMCVWRQR